MSTVDLILLGALMEKPRNAYEMKKVMEYRNIRAWVKISTPSIYKNLVALNKKGYLDSETVKESEMPEKTIYSINEKGRAYFVRLMEKYSEEPGAIYIDFMAFVVNLKNVEPEKGVEMIKSLRKELAKRMDYIQSNIEEKKEFVPFQAISMLELYKQMYTLFYDWSEEFMREYAKNNSLDI